MGADGPETDLDRLQGTWKTVRIESEGKEVTTGGDRLVIDGDRFRASGRLVIEGFLNHRADDPTKRLEKEILYIGGKAHRTRYVGLCSLEGDVLKECLALPGAAPPTEFASRGDSQHVFDTWRRTEGKPDAGLEGSWSLADRVAVGSRQAAHRNRGITMTIKRGLADGQYHYAIRNDYEGRGRIEIDATAKIKQINLICDNGYEGDHLYGIYQLQGDRFVNCFTVKRTNGRPTSFVTKPGDFHWLTVYAKESTGKPTPSARVTVKP